MAAFSNINDLSALTSMMAQAEEAAEARGGMLPLIDRRAWWVVGKGRHQEWGPKINRQNLLNPISGFSPRNLRR